MTPLEKLPAPIGKFQALAIYTKQDIQLAIAEIETLPERLIDAVKLFSESQFDTPYRDGGWTVKQVVHHMADSHMHAYIRVKWSITEEHPTIKAYSEKLWATTPETTADAHLSIQLIKALHAKWVVLLKNLSDADFEKTFHHPQSGKDVRLNQLTAMYAWHSNHHLAHITELKKLKGW
ncbi:MAG: YfiT family bacillithiol transferase [Chryseotalea sp.]